MKIKTIFPILESKRKGVRMKKSLSTLILFSAILFTAGLSASVCPGKENRSGICPGKENRTLTCPGKENLSGTFCPGKENLSGSLACPGGKE